MKPGRIGRLAVLGAALALAVPAVAPANEVTKWNEIAITTVNAQLPITSAPSAASIFVAMVQGAVYGAVNAVDRHGRPYLVNRSYPKASAEAAAATAAFRVLDTLFPAQHGTLQAAYDASLAGVPNGALKDKGIEVGARSSGSGQRTACSRTASSASNCPRTRSSPPSSRTSSVSTSIPRPMRSCCPWTRRARSRRSIGPSPACR